jgi:predicted ATPase with chaperone activity
VDRAIKAREAAAQRYDERVAKAEASASADTAELARVCGSAEAAAEILGWSTREIRRVVKAQSEADHQSTVDLPVLARRRWASSPPDEAGDPNGHD